VHRSIGKKLRVEISLCSVVERWLLVYHEKLVLRATCVLDGSRFCQCLRVESCGLSEELPPPYIVEVRFMRALSGLRYQLVHKDLQFALSQTANWITSRYLGGGLLGGPKRLVLPSVPLHQVATR
jgi:hypothetical protein